MKCDKKLSIMQYINNELCDIYCPSLDNLIREDIAHEISRVLISHINDRKKEDPDFWKTVGLYEIDGKFKICIGDEEYFKMKRKKK